MQWIHVKTLHTSTSDTEFEQRDERPAPSVSGSSSQGRTVFGERLLQFCVAGFSLANTHTASPSTTHPLRSQESCDPIHNTALSTVSASRPLSAPAAAAAAAAVPACSVKQAAHRTAVVNSSLACSVGREGWACCSRTAVLCSPRRAPLTPTLDSLFWRGLGYSGFVAGSACSRAAGSVGLRLVWEAQR